MPTPRYAKTAADYGRGEHEIGEQDAKLTEAIRTLGERVAAAFASPSYQPPLLPAVALELHTLASSPTVEIKRVVALLEKDAVLAADVLRRARSALYSTTTPVTSLHAAVMRMGVDAVRDMVWEVAMSSRVFRATAFVKEVDDLRAHSTATAHLAKLVASRTAIATDYAFMAGLMHDIGAQMIFLVASEQIKPAPPSFVLAPVVREQHEAASGTIARLWKLPGDLQIVLGSHHAIVVQGHVHPLNAVVAIAESIARKLGVGGPEGADHPIAEPLLRDAKRALTLGDATMTAIEADAQKLLAKLAAASTR